MAALPMQTRWPRTSLVRALAATVGLLAWVQLCWLGFVGGETDDPWTSAGGEGALALLALAELHSIYRAAHDAGSEHR